MAQPEIPSLRNDLSLALRLADVADAISLSRFRADDLVVETKPDLTPVSEADRAVELALRSELAVARPGDAILGEEFGAQGTSAREWVLDPIDGTKNYVRGVPVWATLIGLLDGDAVTIGVVSAPALGRRWWAARGEGAFMIEPWSDEPRRLRVSGVEQLDDASFAFSDAVGWSDRTATGFSALVNGTWRQRGYGDFWSHLLVAEGAVDVAAEPHLATHDMAAFIPIVEEAGGRVTDYDGRSPFESGSALTTNGLLHERVLRLLRA